MATTPTAHATRWPNSDIISATSMFDTYPSCINPYFKTGRLMRLGEYTAPLEY